MYFLLISALLLFATNVHGITKIACYQETMEIICGGNNVIHIISANYGRKSQSICSDNGVPTNDTDCSAENSLDVAIDWCEGKQSCLIEAGTCLFGDPCYGTFKYLEVQYQCVPDPCGYLYGIACSGANLVIGCGKDEVIQVAKANYGRETYSICSGPNRPVLSAYCTYKNATQVVQDLCNYQQTCTIPTGNPVFGDPCVGTFKYVWVKYKCVKEKHCCDDCSCDSNSSENCKCDDSRSSKSCDSSESCDD